MGRVFEGRFDARGRRIAVVASRFNDFFTRELVAGAMDGFRRHGVAGGRRRHRVGAGELRNPAGRASGSRGPAGTAPWCAWAA